MTLPANLKINVGAQFPALVQGIGPIGVTKKNGIWTITLSAAGLQQETPAGPQVVNDLLLVFDPIVGNWFTIPLSFFSTSGGGTETGPIQRSITSVGQLPILATDQQLNLNLSAAGTITLPPFAPRNGLALTFKDVGMQATANPQTLAAAAGETIDGFASILMDTNGESIHLVPANDGLNTGWFST